MGTASQLCFVEKSLILTWPTKFRQVVPSRAVRGLWDIQYVRNDCQIGNTCSLTHSKCRCCQVVNRDITYRTALRDSIDRSSSATVRHADHEEQTHTHGLQSVGGDGIAASDEEDKHDWQEPTELPDEEDRLIAAALAEASRNARATLQTAGTSSSSRRLRVFASGIFCRVISPSHWLRYSL